MEYIPVAGGSHNSSYGAIPKYFKSYLASIAEPTTSRGWSLHEIFKHTQKLLKNKMPDMDLYLDSGGYQIIVGYIQEKRIKEYTDVYHFVLEQFYNQIDYIFSLDINTPNFTEEMLIDYNDYSIESSINLIKKYPELSQKQLFIVQSRVPRVLNDWLSLMEKHSVEDYYDLYSFGGLVGLKTQTRVHFNHFVPMTLWLMTYLKTKGKKPKQIHMLGQSSRVAIITGAILEKLFDIKVTMDSSEIVRFSPIVSKTPMLHKMENEYKVINTLTEMQDMLRWHYDTMLEEELETQCALLEQGKVSNETYNMLLCQNLSTMVSFAESFIQNSNINDIINFTKEDFQEIHPFFRIGRLASELQNNMYLIRTLKEFYDANDFNGIHSYVSKIVESYYDGSKNKTGIIEGL